MGDLVVDGAAIMSPPARLSISDAAEKYVRINVPNIYNGSWLKEITPYLVEPMDNLNSLTHSGLVFIGPSQSGKTDLIVNWAAYSAKVSPADMLVVHISQPASRDFSKRRIDRLIRHSPAIKDRLGTKDSDDNNKDKMWKSGAMLTMAWPSINELSGKPIGRVGLTDYDRIPASIDGEGSAFLLAGKRTQRFGRNAMVLAESSPGRSIIDAEWERAEGSHEFPPCEGIGALYNLGHRAWWYWPCIHCDDYYQASFDYLIPLQNDPKDLMGTAESTVMACPNCGGYSEPRHKSAMNNAGIWVGEGQGIVKGKLVGEPRRSSILSYWMEGPAAAFQSWQELVLKHLQAKETFERSGDEQPLRTTVNTDQGRAYLPKAMSARRTSQSFVNRLDKWPKRTIPAGVRFLAYTVDVQSNKFSIAVHGYGLDLECWAIDRIDLFRSGTRKNDDGRPMLINPAAYIEDWDVLKKYAINRRYELNDGSGRTMGPTLILCDMHGADGVTDNAYEFYRKLVKQELHHQFFLSRGRGQSRTANIRRFDLTYPDTRSRKDSKTNVAGDIPVYQLNSNRLKDSISGDLQREKPGPGYVHFPRWFPESLFKELTAEEVGPRGTWIPRKSGQANEQWDLMYMAKAAVYIVGADKIDWDEPPVWAEEWDSNYYVDGNTAVYDNSDEMRVLSKGVA